ncbi:hypothetical protein OG571_47690 (plasmid) [Streptomyces sp. NBC_01369]|uniref:hypothetical protein n=1 Tax=Streptomyces sp. NBC_01369 TaxID=2903842 RepID=UPI002F917DB3
MATSSKTAATTGTVYALIDPRDGVTRYIGQTSQTPAARLAGHLSSPAACVSAWFAEMKTAGVQPAIVPLHQDVPVSILTRLEREEITRRLLDGEPLLNKGSTGDARKALAKRAEEARTERVRAAWEEAAHRTRVGLGGPLPPGDIPSAPFPENVWQYIPSLWQAQDAVTEAQESSQDRFDEALWGLERKVRDAEERVSSQLWNSVRAGWGLMRGRDDKVDKKLESMVKGTVGIRCESLEEATRLVTLAPWCIIAITPWAALAARAGLSLDIDDFATWVTDRPEVEDALRFVCRYRPGLLGHLAGMEHYNDALRPSEHLVAAAAAHTPYDVPSEIGPAVTKLLREVARDQMLTAGMAGLLARLDPGSLDDVFGKDMAGSADAQLSLQPGTAAAVIKYLLDNSYDHYGVLDRVLARAAGQLPSTPYPSYSTWKGRGICIAQGVVETLYAAGLVTGPGEPTPAEAEANAKALWTCDLDRVRRFANE